MVKATALWEKAATALMKEMADSDANIAALGKAITALEVGSLLQQNLCRITQQRSQLSLTS